MANKLKTLIKWVYSIEPSWFRNNGWLNESIAGFTGTLIVMFATSGNVWQSVILFSFVSVFYEKEIDPNGWSIVDVLMRVPGMILAVVLYKLL